MKKTLEFEIPGLPRTVFQFMETTVQVNYGGGEAFPLGRADWDHNRQNYLRNKGWEFEFGCMGSLADIDRYTVTAISPNGVIYQFAQGWKEPIEGNQEVFSV